MHMLTMVFAILIASGLAILVPSYIAGALEGSRGAPRGGAIGEGARLSACCFAVLVPVSIGAIIAAGDSRRADVVQLESVDRGSVAASVGFQSGDLITRVNGLPVTHVDELLPWFTLQTDLKLSVRRGEQSMDLELPVFQSFATRLPEHYGLNFPILTKPVSAGEAVRKWLQVAALMLRPVVILDAPMPHFLVSVRFLDMFAFMLAVFSIVLPIFAPLQVFYQRWLIASTSRGSGNTDSLKVNACA